MSASDQSRQRSSQQRRGRKQHAGGRGRGPDQRQSRATDRKKVARDARSVALTVVRAVSERDAYANLALPAELRRAKLDSRDSALATELAYGTLRASGLLDRIIAIAADRDVATIDPPVLDILRLGSYQLLYTRVAPHAAVDTSVELARGEGLGKAGAFVNAVLRKVSSSTTGEWENRLRDGVTDPIERLAVTTAHPLWIARAFATALGDRAGELPELLDANDARPLVHLAARPGEITAEELALVTGGSEGALSPYAVHLDSGDPGELEPIRDRMAHVQDEGSQLVTLALTRTPVDGDTGRWLDLCAGPGGKAALLGAIAGIEGGTLDAVEIAPHRANLVEKAVAGMPVTVHVVDGRQPGLDEGSYDRVLLDAPCTGLGALRRRPESRWRRTSADVAELVTLQRELLDSALNLVRPGGVVLYATCSPHLSETVSVVRPVLRREDVEAIDLRRVLPEVTDAGDGPWLQLWPHRHGTDAMFMAALRRK